MTTPDSLVYPDDATEWGLTDSPILHLLAAQAAVRAWCRWHIAPAMERTVTLDLDGSGIAMLPAMEVTAVASVLVDGVEQSIIRWSSNGVLEVPARHLRRGLVVTFTSGYDSPPEDVQGVVLSIAARSADTLTGVTRESAGPFTIERAAVGASLVGDERLALAPYRLP